MVVVTIATIVINHMVMRAVIEIVEMMIVAMTSRTVMMMIVAIIMTSNSERVLSSDV